VAGSACNKLVYNFHEFVRFLGLNPVSCIRYHLDRCTREQLLDDREGLLGNVFASSASDEEGGTIEGLSVLYFFRHIEVAQVVDGTIEDVQGDPPFEVCISVSLALNYQVGYKKSSHNRILKV